MYLSVCLILILIFIFIVKRVFFFFFQQLKEKFHDFMILGIHFGVYVCAHVFQSFEKKASSSE